MFKLTEKLIAHPDFPMETEISYDDHYLVGLDYLDGVDGYSSATNDQFEMLAIKAKALLNS